MIYGISVNNLKADFSKSMTAFELKCKPFLLDGWFVVLMQNLKIAFIMSIARIHIFFKLDDCSGASCQELSAH